MFESASNMTQKKGKWIILCGVVKGTQRRKFTWFPAINIAFTKCNKQLLSLEPNVSRTLIGTCSFVDMIFHILCVMAYAARMVSYAVFIPTWDLRYEHSEFVVMCTDIIVTWLWPLWYQLSRGCWFVNLRKSAISKAVFSLLWLS